MDSSEEKKKEKEKERNWIDCKFTVILKLTVKILKVLTPEKFAVIILKYEQGDFTLE